MSKPAMTYRDFAQQVLAAADIVEVVEGYIGELKRAGANRKGLCPFHQEKTPSFNVHPGKQIFKCFGCGKGGDVITFVREIERAEYREALEILARKYGLEVPRLQSQGPSDEKMRWRQTLGEALEAAAQYYQQRLAHPREGAKAREYLDRRGIGADAVERFRLGWAGESWDGLCEHMRGKGFSPRALLESGLAREKKSGQGIIDYLRNRLLFPIANARGKVIAFGGRILEGDGPKYLNTAETQMFRKGRELYGLFQGRDALTRQEQPAILVEGYMDVIACHQAGLTSAVASMGTALTQDQTRQLRRYAHEAVFLYDADEAGIKAMLRGLEALVGARLAVRVAQLPPGQDPDSYLRENGPDALREAVGGAPSFFDFLVAQARSRYDLDVPEEKVRVLEIFTPILAAIDEELVYDGYVSRLASALDYREETLRGYLKKQQRKTARPAPRGATSGADSAGTPAREPAQQFADEMVAPGSIVPSRHEIGLLHILIEHPDARGMLRGRLEAEWLRHPMVRHWVKTILELDDGITDVWHALTPLCETDAQRSFLESTLFGVEEPLEDYVSVLEHLRDRISCDYRRRRNRGLIGEMRSLEDSAGLPEKIDKQMDNFRRRTDERKRAQNNPCVQIKY